MEAVLSARLKKRCRIMHPVKADALVQLDHFARAELVDVAGERVSRAAGRSADFADIILRARRKGEPGGSLLDLDPHRGEAVLGRLENSRSVDQTERV